jgi:AcrR family transcriptional regulator
MILDAAREIIATKGIDGLSMRGLARRIDYSPAGLYEYFAGKDEIIDAVCDQGHQRLFDYLDQVDKSLAPTEYIQAVGLAYIRFALENRDHFLLMFTHMPADTDKNAEEVEAQTGAGSGFGILLDGVRRGIEAGVFVIRPGFGVLSMAYAAWAMVHGIAMLRLTTLRSYPIDFEQGDREALAAFAHGLTKAG